MHQDDFDDEDQEPPQDPFEDIKRSFLNFFRLGALVLWILMLIIMPIKTSLFTTALIAAIYIVWPRSYHS